MSTRLFILLVQLIFLVAFPLDNSMAGGDLDDGISKYTDDSIAKNDKAGKTDTNISYIIVKAKSKAKNCSKNSKCNNGDNNENSIVIGPGSNVKEVINIVSDKK